MDDGRWVRVSARLSSIVHRPSLTLARGPQGVFQVGDYVNHALDAYGKSHQAVRYADGLPRLGGEGAVGGHGRVEDQGGEVAEGGGGEDEPQAVDESEH